MSFLDFIPVIGKVSDIIDQAVVDKDKKIELEMALKQLKEQVYMKELETKTVPWVDALHKMQRGILSVLAMGVGFFLVSVPDIDPMMIASILAPAGIYNGVKGRGKP